MKFCEFTNCPNVAGGGLFCAEHKNAPRVEAKQRHPNDKFYARAAWRGPYGVRRYKLLRNPICEFVGEDGTHCARKAEDVHHIDSSWKQTGDWQLFMGGIDMQNLQSLCKPHHSAITMNQIKDGTSVSVTGEVTQCKTV